MTEADTAPRPTASIIVCTYSNERLGDLTACLDGVRDQTCAPAEVIVVVDHNDMLLQHLSRESWLTVVPNLYTQGLSGARNTGLERATGDVVVFLDDDAVPDRDWLEQLVAPFADPQVVAVGGRIDPAWPADRPWWFPVHLDWTVGCSIPSMPVDGGPIRNVFGASAAFRRGQLEAVGGFASELGRVGADGAGCEETDVCIRLRAAQEGAAIVYAPRSTVLHRVTPGRCTPGYVMRRCMAEGRSKARLAARVGVDAATSEERAYGTLIAKAVARDVATAPLHPSRVGRAGVLAAGLMCASAGYLRERVRLSSTNGRTSGSTADERERAIEVSG
jgi:glycosyltransferase involved in cell wall biosynthesis